MNRTAWTILAAALLASPGGANAQDQARTQDRGTTPQHDLTPDQDRTRLQIRDQLVADKSATEADLAALDPEIAAWSKAKGDPKEMRSAAREMAGAACKGACLRETFRAMNAEMSRGATSAQARERAVASAGARSGGAEAPRTEAAREQEREHARDRTHERTQAHESHSTGGKGGPR